MDEREFDSPAAQPPEPTLPEEFFLTPEQEAALDNLVRAVQSRSAAEADYADSLLCVSAIIQRLRAGGLPQEPVRSWLGALFRYPDGGLSLIFEKGEGDIILDIHVNEAGKLCLGGVSSGGKVVLLQHNASSLLTLNDGSSPGRTVAVSSSTANLWALGQPPPNRFEGADQESLWGYLGGALACTPSWGLEALPQQEPAAAEQLSPPPRMEDIKGAACAACGAMPASADAQYCRSCGAKLPQRAPSRRCCTGCGAALRAVAKFCPNCGAAVSENGK